MHIQKTEQKQNKQTKKAMKTNPEKNSLMKYI